MAELDQFTIVVAMGEPSAGFPVGQAPQQRDEYRIVCAFGSGLADLSGGQSVSLVMTVEDGTGGELGWFATPTLNAVEAGVTATRVAFMLACGVQCSKFTNLTGQWNLNGPIVPEFWIKPGMVVTFRYSSENTSGGITDYTPILLTCQRAWL